MSLGLTMYTIGMLSKQSLAIMILQHLYCWLQSYIIDYCKDVFQYFLLLLNNQGITQISSYDHGIFLRVLICTIQTCDTAFLPH